MKDEPRRALIVTLGRARGALAALRALSQAGWVVGVGAPAGEGLVMASRWCAQRHVVPRPRGNAEGFITGVRRAVADGGYDVVFGAADDWMAALSTYRKELDARVAHPPQHVVFSALDKVRLADRAAGAGLAAPQTEVATDDALTAWEGPVMVKCRAHWSPGQQHTYRIEARRFANVDAAAERVRYLRDAGFEPVLQRPIDGQLGALIGLMHHGQLVGRVQQRTSRLWPTPSGVSARAETVAVDEDLAKRAAVLLDDLGWTGLVELQFLIDSGGVPHLIDLNGRFYGSMALANAAGPNLPDAWGRQVLEMEVPALADAPAGVRFSWLVGDLRRAHVERRGGLVRDIASTLWWARSAHKSVWDIRDLGPTWNLVRGRVSRTMPEPSL